MDADLASLTPPERELLAVLAVMADVALSPEQLAALTPVADPRPILAGLERRGFVEREADDRYRIAADRRERLSEAWNVVDTGDRVLRQLISIAEDGRLTWSDLDAVLGVSGWACEFGRFEELLRLVQAVQTTVDGVRRIEAWVVIVRRALQAARAVGDVDMQAWAEQELAKYSRLEARAGERARRSLARRLAPAAAAAAAAGVGLAVGYAIFNTSSPDVGATTVSVPPSTVTLGGTTTTVPGTTVTVPGAVTTVTVTTTVTTTPTSTGPVIQ